ncbi:MAG: hypothetical protein AAB402_00045 [Patescibacteria group bacterium]
MPLPSHVVDLLTDVGLPADRLDRIVSIVPDIGAINLTQLPLTSTADPQRRWLHDGAQLKHPLRVQGATWLIELMIANQPRLNVRINHVWCTPQAVIQDVADALLRLIYRDPSADIGLVGALKSGELAKLWIAGRFLAFPGSSLTNDPFTFQRRPVAGVTAMNTYHDFLPTDVPGSVATLVKRYGWSLLDDWRDPQKQRMYNLCGDPDFALPMLIRTLSIRRLGNQLHLTVPSGQPMTIRQEELPSVKTLCPELVNICLMHGRHFVDRLWREAPSAG